ELVERDTVDVFAIIAEGVEVAVADPAPIDEFDPQLERAVGGAQKLVLVDIQHAIEMDDGRNGRFTDADCSDRIAFDERNLAPAVIEETRGCRSGHPARRTPSHDHDSANLVIATIRSHGLSPPLLILSLRPIFP